MARFRSDRQRRAIMADLSGRGKYARFRIKDPKYFVPSSFRTQDIGRKGHSKRVAAKLKSTGKFATQSVLVSKPDYKKGLRVFKTDGRFELVKT